MKERSDGMALVGRILLASLFIWSGWGKLNDFVGTAGFIGSQGLPMPQVLAAIAIAVELGGGVLLLIGLKARWVALALVVFLIVITPIFHNFWDAPAAEAQMQEINFLKNVAIMGGIFMVAAFGPGRLSIDRA
jgi:putative oxidoreductase